MSNQQLAEDIQGVHDYIAEHGWCRGRSYDNQGRACLVGGIFGLFDNLGCPSDISRVRAMTDAMTAEIGQHVELTTYSIFPHASAVDVGNGSLRDPVPYFNDKVLNSQEEALEFLQKVRIQVEEKA